MDSSRFGIQWIRFAPTKNIEGRAPPYMTQESTERRDRNTRKRGQDCNANKTRRDRYMYEKSWEEGTRHLEMPVLAKPSSRLDMSCSSATAEMSYCACLKPIDQPAHLRVTPIVQHALNFAGIPLSKGRRIYSS